MTAALGHNPNRRQELRVTCRIDIVAICDTGRRVPGYTIDIAESGIKMRLETPPKELRGHTIEALEIPGVGRLAVNLRWTAGYEAGLALTGDNRQRDLVHALLTHLETRRRNALSSRNGDARPR